MGYINTGSYGINNARRPDDCHQHAHMSIGRHSGTISNQMLLSPGNSPTALTRT